MDFKHFDPFDKHRRVRKDVLDDKTISGMPAVQRAALFALADADVKEIEAEKAHGVAEKAMYAAARGVADASHACQHILPPVTAHDVWTRDVARLAVPPTPKALLDKLAAAQRAETKAQDALELRRAEEVIAKRAWAAAKVVLDRAIVSWWHVDGAPKTTADLVRLNSAAEIKRKMAILAGDLPPDPVAPGLPPNAWPLQIAMANKGSKQFTRKVYPIAPKGINNWNVNKIGK